MQNKEKNYKKMVITVNGEPVGNGLLIDKVTYAPISKRANSNIASHHNDKKTVN